MTKENFSNARRWVRENVEFGTLLFFALGVLGFWALAELADEVIEGSTRNLDRDLLLLLRTTGDHSDPIGPAWIEEVVRDFTAIGGVAILTLTTLAVAGFFLLQNKFATALYLFAAVGGGLLISSTAKGFFDRPRPELVPYDSFVNTSSFPSGHSMMAAVVYLTLGVLVARTLLQTRLKVYVLTLAVIATLLVGISRVYLGVHWPTDVLAGWLAGFLWASICMLGARYLARRGGVEQEASGKSP
ncbi:phosphatase PAP2 family protein [Pararhodobacter sp. SW119]|uniref:phosphatase PAP2 family protein n=1 Tax=Pararhodobacter sp. SW119 TaxID=2780075 RepID=UPI001ADFFFDB|nr:phosphatase PAP2 family protein [Pararhodobacter sp. SW119]